MAVRDTYRYELRRGGNVLYVGITKNPERRVIEHSANKDFGSMHIVGPRVSRQTAEAWETQRIDTYKRNHGGNRPMYNLNDSGK